MNPISVDFPLRGEWTAATTPGYKVPSHGTDMLGMTYAYDFVRLDWSRKGIHLHTKGMIPYMFTNIPLEYSPGWGQKIFSPVVGQVIEVIDGIHEPKGLNLFRDVMRPLLNEVTFTSKKLLRNYRQYTGNYIVIEFNSGFAAFAHIKPGSIAVNKGQEIKSGQLLGEVGHSGNSGAPHLHFQLMDCADITKAKGIPCCFKSYEVLRDGDWQKVENEIPKRWERIKVEI